MTTPTDRPAVVLPGATIGFLGGGQLGRMAAMAARTLGYNVHVLDPDPDCAAKAVADRVVTARFDDAEAAADLARHCDVVTMEIEQIGPAALEAAGRHAPLRPGAHVLRIVQDRAVQKRWLSARGFPLGEYAEVRDAEALSEASRRMGALFVKATHGGYDGRSQARVAGPDEAPAAWASLGGRPAVAERALDLDAELSVMVARAPDGRTAVFPVARNHHERQVLAWSVVPGGFGPEVESRATVLATRIADAIALEGLLAVEMFLTRDGALLVNELAPRPHNSFHETEVACLTSQFEQLVRAVCGLPLGQTQVLRPGAIVNVFGDLWQGGTPDFAAALSEPGTRLHLYGKRVARNGRKMGHVSAIGDSAEEALARAQAAYGRLVADA